MVDFNGMGEPPATTVSAQTNEHQTYIQVGSVYAGPAGTPFSITSPGYETQQQELVNRQNSSGMTYYDADGSMAQVVCTPLYYNVTVTDVTYDNVGNVIKVESQLFVMFYGTRTTITGFHKTLERDRTIGGQFVPDRDNPNATAYGGTAITFSYDLTQPSIIHSQSKKNWDVNNLRESSSLNWEDCVFSDQTVIDMIYFSSQCQGSILGATTVAAITPILQEFGNKVVEESSDPAIIGAIGFSVDLFGFIGMFYEVNRICEVTLGSVDLFLALPSGSPYIGDLVSEYAEKIAWESNRPALGTHTYPSGFVVPKCNTTQRK